MMDPCLQLEEENERERCAGEVMRIFGGDVWARNRGNVEDTREEKVNFDGRVGICEAVPENFVRSKGVTGRYEVETGI